jgi:hypothetical protein
MAPLLTEASHQWRFVMTKLPIALALVSLVIANSTVGATAAVAVRPVHASIVRHAIDSKTRVYGRLSAPTVRATQPRDRDPFADMLLG